MSRARIVFLTLFLLLPAPAIMPQNPVTTTTLKSSSAALQLPGSLTLTATVAPPAATAGMPSGSVQFFNNKANLVGTAPLTAIPSTESFSTPAITGAFGDLPYGLFTLPSTTPNYSVLGVLDYYVPVATADISYPELTIYSGKGANLFATSAVYQMPNSDITSSTQGVDAFAVADFNHDGVTDVLIHGYNGDANSPDFGNEYYVLPGKSGGTFDPATSVLSPDKSGITCDCGNPTQVIAVDDFNGDGYPDIAYAANGVGSNGLVGVALNAGAAAPGSFTQFITAPAVTVTTTSAMFQPAAIASGHFTSSGHADLVVAGTFGSPNWYVALFLGKGDGTFAAPTTTATAASPSAVAAADFRNNGTTDMVVANETINGGGSIQVFFGDGQGHLASSSTVNFCATSDSESPASLLVQDFNNDGFPDILATGTSGSLCLLLNDGTGHFTTATSIGQSLFVFSLTAAGDFNGDGLADVAQITTTPACECSTSTASALLNSASSQAVLATAPQTVPAGTDALTATFPANANFATSTSAGVKVTVTQTAPTLTWLPPAPIEYGVPLGPTQLDATASVAGTITYAPAAGAVLPPGPTKVDATFVPTDTFDYTGAAASQTTTVTAPSLTGISPTNAKLGGPNTRVTVAGQGFVNGATVELDGSPLATTWVSLNELTAIVPALMITKAEMATITVVDPNKIAVAGSETFTVIANDAVAKASAKATVEAGQDASLTLTVNPYPAPISATLNLAFTPDPPNTVIDPTVLFANNSTTDVIQIPASSTAPIPAIDFSTGSTAGTITVTITLNAGGADVTPTTLAPVVVAVPPAPPVINSTTITRNGTTMTIAILGLSSTREMSQATFHFTPASGQSLTTTDLTVDLTPAFTTWYQSAGSDRFGTTFLYTQPFTLSTDSSSVGSVSVTLSNSQGASQPTTAQ
ncbi:MAG: FG-GAP-like repeat-containing protein [Terracidiphilus sp.]